MLKIKNMIKMYQIKIMDYKKLINMEDYLKSQAWDNFNWNLYLKYLQAKFEKEESEYLNKQGQEEYTSLTN